MTTPLLFPGFDGLMTLSRREGVDIKPTLLRVLTDLYVQANAHSADEERQFVELTSRLIDEVDDATRAAGRTTERGAIAPVVVEPVDAAERCRRDQRHVLPRQRQRARLDPAQFPGDALKGFGANSSPARRTRHRNAGDGSLRRRRRELHAGARRGLDPAGADHRAGGQRSRRRATGLRRQGAGYAESGFPASAAV